MRLHKILKKFISILLLYTILFLNSSLFYIFAEEINITEINEQTTEQNKDETTEQNKDETTEQNKDTLQLHAKNAVLIDAKTGIVLYDKNMNEQVYPASTTKIMTALIAIENSSPDDIVEHSHNAVFNIGKGSSNIGMNEGEKISMQDALYGVMIASANEVCMAIAETVSGSVESFLELMNERAKKIGAINTNFMNPHGYHDDNHYTTSYDMSLIMKEAIKNELFVNLISTNTHTIQETNLVNEKRVLNNSNRSIRETSSFFNKDVIGSKTGFTNEAGNTLVTYAQKDDIELIAVVMQDEGTNTYVDTKKMLDYGFGIYEMKEIFDKTSYETKTEVIQKFEGRDIKIGDIYIVGKENVFINLPKIVDVSKIEKNVTIDVVKTPVQVGDKVGKIDFTYNGDIIASTEIVSKNKIDSVPETELKREKNIKNIKGFLKKAIKIIGIAIVVIIISIIILIPITRAIARKLRRRKSKNRYYNRNKRVKPIAKNNKKRR